MSWSREPPLTTEIIAGLQTLVERHGDVPLVMTEGDTGWLLIPHIRFESEPARIEVCGNYAESTFWTRGSTP